MINVLDFVKYSSSFSNSKEICEKIDELLESKEDLALLFSRAYRNNYANGTPYVKMEDAIKFYKNLPHQNEAFELLEKILLFHFPTVYLPLKSKKIKEPIYFSQRDNYRDPHRTCNASATAMAVKMLRPNILNGDDEFVREVFKIGDTTVHWVVDKACEKFGVKARFDTKMTYASLKEDLQSGLPVVISILHRGTTESPTGGHMVLAYEWIENEGIRVHDPYGNLYTDYTDGNGKALVYKFSDLNRRWLNAYAPNVGWGRRFK